MPFLIPLLMFVAGSIFTRIVVGLGIGFVTYTVSNYLFSSIIDLIQSQVGLIGTTPLQLLKLSGFFDVLNILFSAFGSALAIKYGKKVLTFGLGL